MKIEKFKVLLYLKKSGMDKNGKAPIMGRITVNRTMAQFSCKLSCTPSLWNPRASRLEGKSKEAVETNKDIVELMKRTFQFIANFEGEIPGQAAKDCGNYLLHDLPMAKYESKKYLEEVLNVIKEENLIYPTQD